MMEEASITLELQVVGESPGRLAWRVYDRDGRSDWLPKKEVDIEDDPAPKDLAAGVYADIWLKVRLPVWLAARTPFAEDAEPDENQGRLL